MSASPPLPPSSQSRRMLALLAELAGENERHASRMRTLLGNLAEEHAFILALEERLALARRAAGKVST